MELAQVRRHLDSGVTFAAPQHSPQRGANRLLDSLSHLPQLVISSNSIFKYTYQTNKSLIKMPSATGSSEKPSNSSIEPNPVTDSSISTSGAAQTATNTTSHTKTEAEEAADRLYEERIEDEYAKREGGA